eukprot:CAMPEP_0113638788 /NCGR_PEP_ID=MMETSP0017_2-20120614/20334_1 /TAXON_ID=2856 /ORGANISM="Cylindrotheca closterium" /LENGTH=913 /DNA_ID=CAMNT_0000549941 /DNA_START=732 /DNA_END=3473 /DNA_ORIENTATION=- /assembly_acc=CAM_ASM_000147
MSETTSVVKFDLASKWRTMDSVNFDDDSTQDGYHERQDSKDTQTSFDLDMNMSNDLDFDHGHDEDENDTLDLLQKPNTEQHPLLQSPEKTAPKDSFPDTPNNMLGGWNLANHSTSNNNIAQASGGGSPSGTANTNGTTTHKSTSAADLLDQIEGPILQVMDRIEDEVEAHAYEDVVPLDIKLAIEDKVFGWTHFTSSFFGHIAFTVGAYLIVFHGFTMIWMQAFYRGGDAPRPPTIDGESVMEWYWEMLRTMLALWAGAASYRMVRRRRHVWFRAPYGSKAYKQDGARRIRQVRETDRSTRLGSMLLSIRHERVLKTLRKAENRFAKKHNNTVRLRKVTLSNTGSNDLLDEPDPPSMVEGSPLLSSTTSTHSCTSSEEEEEMSSDNSYGSTSSAGSPNNSSVFSQKKRKKVTFSTKPTNLMESFAHDQVLFPTIHKMPYAHGAYFGAAPFLLSNPHWISILRLLMPDVYVEISRRVVNAPASRLIHWAENNPVVAAYASVHELEYKDSTPNQSYAIPNLEWDVFLDPKLVQRVQIVLDERDKFIVTCKDGGSSSTHPKSDRARQILSFYQRELDQRAMALVDKMLIAHGNLTQLVLEQTGYVKNYNYSRVKRTRRTLGGGIYARQWMAVFAEAMKLGTGYIEEKEQKDPTKRRLFRKSKSLLDLADSKCPDSTMSESIRLLQKLTKCEKPVGLVLDIKSRHVSKHIWSLVIDTLRKAGVRVEGIASFFVEEIRNVSVKCVEPVQEIIFCHSAGDLQKACNEGRIRNGDSVFFNAGCLLWDPSPDEVNRITNFDPNEIKSGYKIQSFGNVDETDDAAMTYYSTIQMYKERFNLRIGLYVQEFAIDEAAIAVLSQYFNDHPDIFDLGFAWGGINGITIRGIKPGRFTATDGLWNQRYIGELWNDTQFPPRQGQFS